MKPIQYQKGYIEFYKLRFKVTPDVLIPRPETELLVDEVLQFLKNYTLSPKPHPLTMLDLGTGAGNIAISIAKNLSVHPRGVNINIIATDISHKALKIAKQNAKLHGVTKLITFLKSDLLSFCYDRLVYHNKLLPDIIGTNLPYIPTLRIPYLDPSVKDFEPKVALDGGEDGFELYRKLFQQIAKFSLTPIRLSSRPKPSRCKPKLIIGEIDYTHGELAVNEAYKYFPDSEIEVKLDLAKKQRILLIR